MRGRPGFTLLCRLIRPDPSIGNPWKPLETLVIPGLVLGPFLMIFLPPPKIKDDEYEIYE
jgi:hypothetical protein